MVDFKRHCWISLHGSLLDKNDTSFDEHLAALSSDISEIILSTSSKRKEKQAFISCGIDLESRLGVSWLVGENILKNGVVKVCDTTTREITSIWISNSVLLNYIVYSLMLPVADLKIAYLHVKFPSNSKA